MTTEEKMRFSCPKCGDSDHIYARLDVIWRPAASGWTAAQFSGGDPLECTECDHEFYADDVALPVAPDAVATAAPELIEALRKIAKDAMSLANDPVMRDRSYFYNIGRDAEKAIAKATGAATSDGFKCQSCGRDEADCSADPCVAVIADREA